MTATKGELMLLKIGDGQNPESFTSLAGLRTTRLMVNRQVVAAHNVDNAGWRNALGKAGTATVKIQATGLCLHMQAEATLRQQVLEGEAAQYELYFGNGDKLTGSFVIGNYERSGKMGDLEGFGLTLESAGAVAFEQA